LGIVKTYMGAVVAKTLKIKPKVIVLFISKFDLFSICHPEDSSSTEIKQKVLSHFKDHIEIIVKECKKTGIPCEIIVGSSTEKWNTSKVLEKITDTLYKHLNGK
jgi:hypothetical protein